MVAHLNTVTSLAMDPQQTCLVSGSKSEVPFFAIEIEFVRLGHDRSIRLWNLESKNCMQEFTAHQKKDDESVHDIAFHASKPYLASVGADSIAKIYA
jgi:striatin 1/3/4